MQLPASGDSSQVRFYVGPSQFGSALVPMLAHIPAADDPEAQSTATTFKAVNIVVVDTETLSAPVVASAITTMAD